MRSAGLDGDAALANRLGERAHVAVIAVAAAVEDGLGDAGRLGPLGERRAGPLGPLGLGQLAQLGLVPVDRRQRAPRHVVDQLRADAAVGAEHRDPRALRRARDLRANATAPFEPALGLGDDAHARLPTFLWTYSPS